MSNKGDYKTVPATPGLLIIQSNIKKIIISNYYYALVKTLIKGGGGTMGPHPMLKMLTL